MKSLVKHGYPHKLYEIDESDPLGRGGFGAVYLGYALDKHGARKKKTVAIKAMSHKTPHEQSNNLNELRFLSRIVHPSIVKYRCSFLIPEEEAIWMVMENMEGGTLKDAKRNFEEKHIAYVAKNILEALNYLHSHHMIHRDLKSENIMLTNKGDVKLIDFGLSEFVLEHEIIDIVGSPFWISPEMICFQPHSYPTDVWSFGISLLELINQLPPNHSSAFRAMYFTATEGVPEPFNKPKRWSPLLHDFVQQILVVDPSCRPLPAKALEHQFLNPSSLPLRHEMASVISSIFMNQILAETGLGF